MVTISAPSSHITWELEPAGCSLLAQVGDDWDALERIDAQAPVFNAREWFALAARDHLLKRWYALTVRRHDRPIALLPLRKRTPWSWETLSWFGQDDPQILIDPLEEEAAWQGVAHWLGHYPGAGYLTLGACGDAARIQAFARACAGAGLLPIINDRVPPSVLCPLPHSWDELLHSLEAAKRAEIRRAERLFARDFPDAEVEILQDPAACQPALDDLVELYRTRWGGRGGGCLFDFAPNIAYYHRVMAWALAQRYAVVGALRVQGRRIIVQTVLHIPGQSTVYMHMNGRDVTALPNRYSPGIVVFCHLLRWAIDRGATTANLGPGALPYKLIFNGAVHPRAIIGAARGARHAATLPALDRLVHIAHRAPVHAANYLRGRLRTLGVGQESPAATNPKEHPAF